MNEWLDTETDWPFTFYKEAKALATATMRWRRGGGVDVCRPAFRAFESDARSLHAVHARALGDVIRAVDTQEGAGVMVLAVHAAEAAARMVFAVQPLEGTGRVVATVTKRPSSPSLSASREEW